MVSHRTNIFLLLFEFHDNRRSMVFHISDRDHAPAIVQSHDNRGSMISHRTNKDHALDLFSFF